MVVANYLTSRRNLAGSFLALLGLLLAVVDPVGPQGFITDRNLERALVPGVVPPFGEADLDAAYLGGLGADAVPALVVALPTLPEPQRTQLRSSRAHFTGCVVCLHTDDCAWTSGRAYQQFGWMAVAWNAYSPT